MINFAAAREAVEKCRESGACVYARAEDTEPVCVAAWYIHLAHGWSVDQLRALNQHKDVSFSTNMEQLGLSESETLLLLNLQSVWDTFPAAVVEVGAARLQQRDIPTTHAATAGVTVRHDARRYSLAAAGAITLATATPVRFRACGWSSWPVTTSTQAGLAEAIAVPVDSDGGVS
jgi:hypothetical protein